MVKIERGGRILIAIIGGALILYSASKYGLIDHLFPAGGGPVSPTKPQRVDLPSIGPSLTPNVPLAKMPGLAPGCQELPPVRMLVWAWNAQMGLMFANGGAQATTGSLMCAAGVNLELIRQDDSSKMQDALVAFATALKAGGPHREDKGAHFVSIMADGSAAFLAGVNPVLRRLGSEYIAKVVGSAGFSRGEDKLMGPPAWKANPQAAKGGTIAGVPRDGDWNIAQKWAGDNGILNNPNEKTYDPDRINWIYASDYVDAAAKYITHYCEAEPRPVVRNGKRTGEFKQVCAEAVVTWTPGDADVAHKRGGLVSIVSTREYASQMPNAIIGIDHWMGENPDAVALMLNAMFAGANQVRQNPEALSRAAMASAAVYHEADGPYWERYYRGVTERDATGLMVELGGSTVNNLADNLQIFGLTQGSANLFAATYTGFGDIVVAQYPNLVPSYPPVSEILDTRYLQALANRAPVTAPVNTVSFDAAAPVRTVVSRRSWHINFETGHYTFATNAQGELQELLRDLLIASGTAVEIHGHTDNVGSLETNQRLSEDRAFAVKNWLEQQSPTNFPAGRLRVFSHGSTNPVAPNSTDAGRAANRRVDIVLGTTEQSR